jgi:hypothetical protein
MRVGADNPGSHLSGFRVQIYMIQSYCLRAVNSFEFLGIAVLIAVVLTTGFFSAKAEPDPSIKQQSLVYSHLGSVQKTAFSPRLGSH